jgi:hypothetical protein
VSAPTEKFNILNEVVSHITEPKQAESIITEGKGMPNFWPTQCCANQDGR